MLCTAASWLRSNFRSGALGVGTTLLIIFQIVGMNQFGVVLEWELV
jgi:hypothetical protein